MSTLVALILGCIAVLGWFVAREMLKEIVRREYDNWAPALARALVRTAGHIHPAHAQEWLADVLYLQQQSEGTGLWEAWRHLLGAPRGASLALLREIALLVGILSDEQAECPSKAVALLHGLALASLAVVIPLTATGGHWTILLLALIVSVTVITDLISVQTNSPNVSLTGGGVGLTLAAILLGGSPAAIVGIITIAVVRLRSPMARDAFRNNLVAYAWYPLVTGLLFHEALRIAHVGSHDVTYYGLVGAAYALGVSLNFVIVAAHQSHVRGRSLALIAREALLPALAANLVCMILTVAAVCAIEIAGTIALALVSIILLISQRVLVKLLRREYRAYELHGPSES